jgi:hypothetical protein
VGSISLSCIRFSSPARIESPAPLLPGRGTLSWLVPDSFAYDTEDGEREEREE